MAATRLAFFDWHWQIDSMERLVEFRAVVEEGTIRIDLCTFTIVGGQRISDAPAMVAIVSELEVRGVPCGANTGFEALKKVARLDDLLGNIIVLITDVLPYLYLRDISSADLIEKTRLLNLVRLQCQRAHRRYTVGGEESEAQGLLKMLHHRGMKTVARIHKKKTNGIISLSFLRDSLIPWLRVRSFVVPPRAVV